MGQYVLRRLLMLVPVVFLTLTLVFVLVRLLPGDLATLKLGGEANAQQVKELRKELGLDKPLVLQYVDYLGSAARGDLGRSMTTNRSALTELRTRVPVTVELAVMTTLIGLLIGLPLGVVSATNRDRLFGDHVPRVVGLLGLATPNFWLATLVITFPAIWWHWSPPLKYRSIFAAPAQHLEMMLPAALVLGVQLAAITMRMTRSSMLDVVRSDYVRTARAKGLHTRVVIYRHCLRNGLMPVVTVVGNQLGALLGGAVIIEQIFLLPGVGQLTVNSVMQRDYTQLQACVLFLALAFVLVNLAVDLSYSLIDPRTSVQRRGAR